MNPIRKRALLLAGILIIIAIFAFLLFRPDSNDDWQFKQPTGGESYGSIPAIFLIVMIIVGTISLAWIAGSIILIIQGKKTEGHMHPKRKLGIFFLAGFLFLGIFIFLNFISAILFFMRNTLTLLIIGMVFYTAFIIFGERYAHKNNIRLGKIMLTVSIIFIVLFGAIGIGSLAYFGVLSPKNLLPMNAGSDKMGYSVGGAKDINNFRENIKNNYLPLETDITYEGLFYDYYFDRGQKEACTQLFCPSYTYAISKDPLSQKNDYYLTVGLNSNIKESDFQRKKLNLVIVLDMSGSMSSPFNRYYYDQFGKRTLNPEIENDTTAEQAKMKVATQSVVALLDHLTPDDNFGFVLYDDKAYLARPLKPLADTDLAVLKSHILEIKPNGGTYFEAGYKEGTSLFDDLKDADPARYENRIIFLTDAQPNIGQLDENSLLGLTKKNAQYKIYTTFIGIGVDFNTELIDAITKVRGANYYSVHSPKAFKQRMDTEFEYLVTPLVFNLLLQIDAKGYTIEKVYGSPEANESTGQIMKVNTLFPSKTEGTATKGGIVLLKLKKTQPAGTLHLSVSYEDRLGEKKSDTASITATESTGDLYPNTGIRKAILLSRYADLMKHWIRDERKKAPTEVIPSIDETTGITSPALTFSKWERQSIPLVVSPGYQRIINQFSTYYQSEMTAIGDPTLQKELDIMKKLETS